MTAYAGTSALFVLLHPADRFFEAVNERRKKSGARFLYPPWLRFELRHNLRRARVDADGETAWRALTVAEQHTLQGLSLHLLGQLRRADKLSESQAASGAFSGAGDVLHVAAALHLGVAEFWTCDGGQADFARAAGLRVHQFTL